MDAWLGVLIGIVLGFTFLFIIYKLDVRTRPGMIRTGDCVEYEGRLHIVESVTHENGEVFVYLPDTDLGVLNTKRGVVLRVKRNIKG